MATITQANTKKGNSYRIKISLGKDQYSGKYQWHTETFKGSKADAKIRAKELEVQIAKDQLYQSKGVSCQYLVDAFIDHKSMNIRKSTASTYRISFNRYFLKAFGDRKVDELTTEIFDKFFSNMHKSGLSNTTIESTYKNIKTCLKFGIERGYLESNPLDKIPVPKRKKVELNIPTPEQVNECLEDLKVNSDWVYMVTSIAVLTGMRRGEIIGLKWSDIDFSELSIKIQRAITDVRGFCEVQLPKTKDSIRTIYFGETLKSLLQDWKTEGIERASILESRELLDDDYVFHNYFSKNENVSVYRPSSVTQSWNKVQKRLDLQGVRFHDLRHFHAIQLLLTGSANIKDIQNRLGHSDSKITMDTYMRYIPEDRNKKVGMAADNLVKIGTPVIEGEIVQK